MHVRERTRVKDRQLRRSLIPAAVAALLVTSSACNAPCGGGASSGEQRHQDDDHVRVPDSRVSGAPQGLRLFENLNYELKTPVISGPQNQIAALYAKNIDVGLVGENTAGFEWANADQDGIRPVRPCGV